jgi:hypothetical protein
MVTHGARPSPEPVSSRKGFQFASQKKTATANTSWAEHFVMDEIVNRADTHIEQLRRGHATNQDFFFGTESLTFGFGFGHAVLTSSLSLLCRIVPRELGGLAAIRPANPLFNIRNANHNAPPHARDGKGPAANRALNRGLAESVHLADSANTGCSHFHVFHSPFLSSLPSRAAIIVLDTTD